MKDKLRKLMESERLTAHKLAEMLGTGPSNISHILSGRSKPGFDLLQQILLRFPRINPDWLLLDAQTMYRPEAGNESDGQAGTELRNELAKLPISDPPLRTLFDGNEPSEEKTAPTGCGKTAEITGPNPRNDIRRIVVFYEDQTFESFVPQKNNDNR